MIDIKAYLESGILEQLVLGDLSEGQAREVWQMIDEYPEVAAEYEQVQLSLEMYAQAHAVTPPTHLKNRFLELAASSTKKKVTDITRMPDIRPDSTTDEWEPIIRDIRPPADYEDMYVHPLGADEQKTTLLVWSKMGIEEEIHTEIIEKFIVLEGTCTCYIGDEITDMEPGDVMEIPLHKLHHIQITSSRPLKVVLQKHKAA